MLQHTNEGSSITDTVHSDIIYKTESPINKKIAKTTKPKISGD